MFTATSGYRVHLSHTWWWKDTVVLAFVIGGGVRACVEYPPVEQTKSAKVGVCKHYQFFGFTILECSEFTVNHVVSPCVALTHIRTCSFRSCMQDLAFVWEHSRLSFGSLCGTFADSMERCTNGLHRTPEYGESGKWLDIQDRTKKTYVACHTRNIDDEMEWREDAPMIGGYISGVCQQKFFVDRTARVDQWYFIGVS